jgi:light-independent protochlorophyllide reductase subunit B
VGPSGVGATRDFLHEVAAITGLSARIDESGLRLPWWSASVDSTYLTGKRVFIFGDATHAMAAARIAATEIGFEVVGLGCYNREFARPMPPAAKAHGLDALITDDYLEVEAEIARLQPELILGTQMERHIGKRLGIPCAVISSPVHVQDFPARYSPQMGFEGANVIFDTWIHPLVMGLEEHLLTMFREDFEFHDAAGPSHHGAKAMALAETPGALPPDPQDIFEEKKDLSDEGEPRWLADAERELRKIPFFVRGKAKRNTEKYAVERGVTAISVDTLYEAKAHYAR